MHKKLSVLSSTFLLVLSSKTNASRPIFPAEIVGRDLRQFGLAWVGHVGITIAEDPGQATDQVIEALNDSPVIQINTLADFKSRSAYWGSRYGIADNKELASRVIKEANFQRGLCPIYTSTAAFEPGTGYSEDGKPTHCAVYRCDTFINYVFHQSGYDLPTYNNVTLPKFLFDSFPKGHGDGPLAAEFLSKTQQLALFPSSSTSVSIDNFDVRQLEEMSLEVFMAVVDLPAQKISLNSINNTWEFAKDPALSTEKRIFMVDYLGLVGTVDFIPKFVEQYSKTPDEELKSMLLRSTLTLHQKYSWLQDYPQEKNSLQNFYADLLDKKLSAHDTEIVLRGFTNLSSKDEIRSKVDRISNLLNSGELNLNSNVSIGLWIELLMKSKELEKKFVPEILTVLSCENNPAIDDLFNQFIVKRLGNLGVNALDPESKIQISSYLDSVSYRYSRKRIMGSTLNQPYYGAWLEASALVNSSSLKNAGKYIASFMHHKTRSEQASYRSGLSDSGYLKKALR